MIGIGFPILAIVPLGEPDGDKAAVGGYPGIGKGVAQQDPIFATAPPLTGSKRGKYAARRFDHVLGQTLIFPFPIILVVDLQIRKATIAPDGC